MLKVIKNPAQIVTVNTNGVNYKKDKYMQELEVLEGHSIILEKSLIKDIVPNSSVPSSIKIEIDATNKVVLPGLVECHTHTLFAGSRSHEFIRKLNGANYEEIAAEGGGIISTVNEVRSLDFNELVEVVKPRIDNFISQGVTTLEIKSGYGLDYENEIKMLEVIKYLNLSYRIDIIPTFLGAHTFPAEYKEKRIDYIRLITDRMIPFIAQNKLASFCDVFCEKSAFAKNETAIVLNKAAEYGLSLILHSDQFNSIGGVDLARRYRLSNVNHLEVVTEEGIESLRATQTPAVLLPGVSFFQNTVYAPARQIIDAGVITALATDYNPGSCNISNISMIMGIAAINMKMTPEEIISAYTINAAHAIEVHNSKGSIEKNKKADFAIFNCTDYKDIIYNVGTNLNVMTIKNGEVIYSKEEIFENN